MKRFSAALFCAAALALGFSRAHADQVIMKDGTVYKGKIQIDTDKAVLIGNPPFDPTSYMLEAKDIEKIIYEEYKPQPPAQRKRGFTLESRVGAGFHSGNEVTFKPAPKLYFGAGFRVHPALELDGGLDLDPSLRVKDDFSVSNGTDTRHYQDFSQLGLGFEIRFYPLWQKAYTTEPYLTAGYHWAKLSALGSDDGFKGSGWTIGAGAIHPLTTHIFLEARLAYRRSKFDTVNFLGQESGFSPQIEHNTVSLEAGTSYRF